MARVRLSADDQDVEQILIEGNPGLDLAFGRYAGPLDDVIAAVLAATKVEINDQPVLTVVK